MNRFFALIVAVPLVFVLAGCEQTPATPPAGSGSGNNMKPPAATPEKPAAEKPAEGAKPNDGAGHGGAIIELGTTKIGDLTVRASRDKGDIKAGGDAPIDVWLTTADDKPATVTAVRFWLGTEDAKGSVKAKADIEDPKQPNHWHTHADVPNPIPSGMKLWVEIESKDGKKVGSFDLKS